MSDLSRSRRQDSSSSEEDDLGDLDDGLMFQLDDEEADQLPLDEDEDQDELGPASADKSSADQKDDWTPAETRESRQPQPLLSNRNPAAARRDQFMVSSSLPIQISPALRGAGFGTGAQQQRFMMQNAFPGQARLGAAQRQQPQMPHQMQQQQQQQPGRQRPIASNFDLDDDPILAQSMRRQRAVDQEDAEIDRKIVPPHTMRAKESYWSFAKAKYIEEDPQEQRNLEGGGGVKYLEDSAFLSVRD